jgi:hypothetical protein
MHLRRDTPTAAIIICHFEQVTKAEYLPLNRAGKNRERVTGWQVSCREVGITRTERSREAISPTTCCATAVWPDLNGVSSIRIPAFQGSGSLFPLSSPPSWARPVDAQSGGWLHICRRVETWTLLAKTWSRTRTTGVESHRAPTRASSHLGGDAVGGWMAAHPAVIHRLFAEPAARLLSRMCD